MKYICKTEVQVISDPVMQRRHWVMKRALNRIEFELLIALGGADEDLELLDAEIRSQSDQLARIIQFKLPVLGSVAASAQSISQKKESSLEK